MSELEGRLIRWLHRRGAIPKEFMGVKTVYIDHEYAWVTDDGTHRPAWARVMFSYWLPVPGSTLVSLESGSVEIHPPDVPRFLRQLRESDDIEEAAALRRVGTKALAELKAEGPQQAADPVFVLHNCSDLIDGIPQDTR